MPSVEIDVESETLQAVAELRIRVDALEATWKGLLSNLECKLGSSGRACREQHEACGWCDGTGKDPSGGNCSRCDSKRTVAVSPARQLLLLGLAGDSYRPLLPTYSEPQRPAALPENVQEIEPEELPSSLYNYCMETLTFSTSPHAEMAWLYLLLVSIVQNVLLMTILQMNFDALFDVYAAGNLHASYSFLGHCQTDQRILVDGDFLIRPITAVGGMFVVWMLINEDMYNQGRASFPGPSAPVWLRVSLNLFWFLQAVLLPVTLTMEIGRLLALCKTPMDIVLNTLAATFVVEIDELLFNAILTQAQKHEYNGLSARRQPAVETHRRSDLVLALVRFVGILFQYFWIRHTDFAHDGFQDVIDEVLVAAMAYLLVWFAEVFVRTYRATPPGQLTHGAFLALACGFLSVIVGYCYWTVLQSIGLKHWQWGEATERQKSETWACILKAADFSH